MIDKAFVIDSCQSELAALESELQLLHELESQLFASQLEGGFEPAQLNGLHENGHYEAHTPQGDEANDNSIKESVLNTRERNLDLACGSEDWTGHDSFNSSTTVGDGWGNWQQYSNNTALKYMQKMGYVMGAGLEKHGLGIVDPIQPVIVKPGKGLGFTTSKTLRSKATAASSSSLTNSQARTTSTESVFDFMNTALNTSASSKEQLNVIINSPSVRESKHSNETDRKALIKLHKKSTAIESELLKIRKPMGQIAGNKKQDPTVDSHYKTKMPFLESKLEAALGEEKRVAARLK
ncbi:hypothetical protein BDR26DRAFT_848486 [Obelidium mucronatum]|nr:hypothetical protein BDR26DRAFT_848486 [Obelidium mucronatum]